MTDNVDFSLKSEDDEKKSEKESASKLREMLLQKGETSSETTGD
jgi:hypothetical protein